MKRLNKYAGRTLVAMVNSLRVILVVYITVALAEAALLSVVEHWSYYDSFWFVRVTALTIGYGDLSPHSAPGYVIVTACAHLQILVIVPVIVANLFAKGMRSMNQWTHEEQEYVLWLVCSIAEKLGLKVGSQPEDTSYGNLSPAKRHEGGKMTHLLVRMMNSGKIIIFVYVALVTVTSTALTLIEHWNFLRSLWFSIVTALTIGYGDLSPHTILGREITLLFAHLCIMVVAPSVIAHFALKVLRDRAEWTHKEQEFLIKALELIATFLGIPLREAPPDTDDGDISDDVLWLNMPFPQVACVRTFGARHLSPYYSLSRISVTDSFR